MKVFLSAVRLTSGHENYHFEEGFGNDEHKNDNRDDNDKNVDNDEGIVRVD